MAALDSGIFRDIFTTAEMRAVFSDEARTARYLEVEAALARVQGRLGVIPEEAAAEIVAYCRAGNIDMAELKAETERVGYPVLGVVRQIVATVPGALGQWCHWGATTQDVTDTATALQMRAALELVDAEIERIAAALAALARRHRDAPMAGRSNLQHALPVTFGFKAAALLAAFQRHRQRLRELRPRVLVGQFAGAAGTLASLGADGLRVQAALMADLGLGEPEIAWHTVRDRVAEVSCFLGLVTGTLGKIATDVKLLMQTEVAEVQEPFHAGRGSSSTMPQKRNPISCLYIHATAALVRQSAASLMEAAIADHERSTGPWEIEWITLPEIFLLSSGALAQTRMLLQGLQVDETRMRANLGLTSGLIVSEAVMMALAPRLGRQRAHDLLTEICREVVATGTPLVDLLGKHPEVSQHLNQAYLEQLCDPGNYLGLAGEMVDRVLAIETSTMQA